MDIQKFQQKLTEVCELGEKNGKVLKPEQIKECFGELDLDKSQLIKILQYLKLKGISIEGAEEISAASQTGPEEVSGRCAGTGRTVTEVSACSSRNGG